ncbi:MAG: CBS domain-containing protein, partial [Actinobacteria bacterium]|nr:CBS domain-containing protein [Actinomycetota bacterium]
AFIGWFLNSAAESTRQQQALEEDLRGISVAQVMNPTVPLAEPSMSVQDLVFDHIMRRGHRALVVEDDGRVLGIVSISDVRELPQEEWPVTPVARIMTPAPLKVVSPDADVSQALKLLVESELNQLPVVRDGRLVGMLSRSDIMRLLQLRDELHLQLRGGRDHVRAVRQRGGPSAHEAA